MVRAPFRHVVLMDGSDVVGILSMRDIVRCWTQTHALRRKRRVRRKIRWVDGAPSGILARTICYKQLN